MNIQEDYVSFETAKLLKEKGFDDEYTNAFYDKTGNLYFIDLLSDLSKHPNHDTDIAASTLYVAMKWLREVHNLLIVIDKGENFYAWQLEDNENGDYIGEVVGECSSYEEACESAIKYCLENLITT